MPDRADHIDAALVRGIDGGRAALDQFDLSGYPCQALTRLIGSNSSLVN